jgi:hypothetical protein
MKYNIYFLNGSIKEGYIFISQSDFTKRRLTSFSKIDFPKKDLNYFI